MLFFCRGLGPKCMQITFVWENEKEDSISKKDYVTVYGEDWPKIPDKTI